MHALFHFAYLDPGTGSLIIQSVIGAIAGVLVFGRRLLTKLRYKLSGRSSAAKKDTAPAPGDTTAKTTPTTKDDSAK